MTLIELGETSGSKINPVRVEKGELDFGIGAFELIKAQANGTKLIAVANIYKFSPSAFFARTDTGIQTPADLAGFRIVVKSQGWQDLLEYLLDQGGLTLDDIVPVEGDFDMTPFLEGEVDVWSGYLTDEVIRARMAGLDIVTLPLYEYGISGSAVTVYISHTMLQDPQTVEGFVQATVRGWQWAVENPSEAVDIMLELHPQLDDDPSFYLASFEASIPLIIPGGYELGLIDCDAWMKNDDLIGLTPAEDYCDEQFFEAASE